MRLSEAIRLGAMLHPQCFERSYVANGRDVVASCALHAAVEAGYAMRGIVATGAQCPACGITYNPNGLYCMVVHLNDEHRWTREAIADWVATVEPADVLVDDRDREVAGVHE